MTRELDIVIPVYNEGVNIVGVLDSLARHVTTSFRVLICYDHDHDDTLTALTDYASDRVELEFVKNEGVGVLGAIVTGFRASTAPAVLVFPADDDYNAPRLDQMMAAFRAGCDVVVASRFIPGGCMVDCPPLKAMLVRTTALFMHAVLRVPSHDATNGFRLFSRRVLDRVPVETQAGFAYSMELLAKCHRLGWKIGEVPVHWYERRRGKSRFKIMKWAPHYLRWVRYAIETSIFRRGPETVMLREASGRST